MYKNMLICQKLLIIQNLVGYRNVYIVISYQKAVMQKPHVVIRLYLHQASPLIALHIARYHEIQDNKIEHFTFRPIL